MIKRIAALALSALLAAAPALAQDGEAGAAGVGPFRLSFTLDVPGRLDASLVNRLDRPLMRPYSAGLDRAGTGLALASMLTPAALLAAPEDAWLAIGTMYAETMLLTYGLKELGKLCVDRARPYLYFDGYPEEAEDGDWSDSFPSGHTALAFAGATFASRVFCEYFPGSAMRLPVVASSYALAAGTAALRVASGSHFLTDAIAGAALGTACGLVVPWLHALASDSREGADGARSLSVRAAPMGLLVSFAL